jgi:hypothetical protein
VEAIRLGNPGFRDTIYDRVNEGDLRQNPRKLNQNQFETEGLFERTPLAYAAEQGWLLRKEDGEKEASGV